MNTEMWHTPTMLIEIRGYAADGCTYVRQVTVAQPDALTEDWWGEEVFPLTGDGRHPTIHTLEIATVVRASNPAFIGADCHWEG